MSKATWALFWIIICAILFVVIGVLGHKRTGTISEYLVTRGQFPPEVLGLSHAAKAASAVLFLGLPGMAYTAGYCTMWQSWPFFTAGIIGMLVVAKRFRREAGDCLTVPDWIGERYGSDLLRAGFALIFMFNIAYIGGQLTGLALLYVSLLNVSYTYLLFGFAIVIVFYVLYGGNWAIVWTDAIQSIIMILGSLVLFIACLRIFPGGLGELTSRLSAIDPNLVKIFNPDFAIFSGPLSAIGVIFFAFAFNGANGNTAKQFFTLKHENEAKQYILAALFAFTFFYLMPLAGTYARVLFPDIEPDMAVPTILWELLPGPLAGLISASILSATLSTVDDILLLCGASFSNDIYRKILVKRGWVSKGRTESQVDKTAVTIQRIAIISIVFISAILVVKPPAYLTILASTGSSGFFVSACAPVVLGLYWKKANKWGALAALFVGTFVYVLTNFIVPTPYGYLVNSFFSTSSSFVAMVLVSSLIPSELSIDHVSKSHHSTEI